MRVNFLYSNTFRGAGEMVATRLKYRDKSRRSIVIVPDRFVLSTERSILDGIGEVGSFDIEVVSFTRLAKLVLKQMNKRYLSKDVAIMLMRKVIEDNRDNLTCYKKSVGTIGFPKEIYSAMGNLRNNCIPSDRLNEVVSQLPQGIQDKLNDLFTLYDGYMSALSEGYTDNDSLIDELIEAIPDISDITNCDIYLMEYFYFTIKQREVLRSFMKNAHEVNIALIMDEGYDSGRLYPHALDSDLKAICHKEGIEYTTKYSRDTLPTPMDIVMKRLYSYSKLDKVSSEDMIDIHEADDVVTEVEELALSIVNTVKSGVRYKNIGVAISNPESYLPTIERVFTQYGITYFADVRKALIIEPISRFVLDYLSFCYEPSVKGLITLAKNVFSGIDYSQVERLENYCLRYAIAYTDISKPFVLGQGNDSLGIKRDLDYDVAENTRREVYDKFHREIVGNTIADFVRVVRDMLTSLDIESKNESFSKRLDSLNQGMNADISKTTYTTILTILDDMSIVMGSNTTTIGDFTKLLEGTLSSTDVGAVPTYVDSVYVGNCRESRYMGVSHLYVVGADADNFPMINEDKGIISSREAKELGKLNIHLEPDIGRRNVEEKLYALQLLIKPTAKLHVSYNTYNGKKPSSAIVELLNIFDDINVVKSYDVLTGDKGISRMPNRKVALDRAVEGVSKYVSGETTREESIAYITAYKMLSNDDTTQALYRKDDVVVKDESDNNIDMFPQGHTSVSQIESYFRCPYGHFLQYALSLKERDSDVKPNLAGTFIHDFLENFVKHYTEVENNEDSITQYADKLFDTLMQNEEYVFYKDTNRVITCKKLRNECIRLALLLMKQINNCAYKPQADNLERRLGERDGFCVERGDGKLNFSGIIDRIDSLDDNCVIIDYKTGHTGGSISDIYYGKKVQVYLYAKALTAGGNTVNGVYYYPIQDSYDKDGKGDVTGQMVGQMLKDIDFFKSMDTSLAPGIKSEYINVALNTDGTVSKRGVENRLLTREELTRLMQYAYDVTAQAVREIDSGIIYKSPNDKKVCDNCKYRDICAPKGKLVRDCPNIEKQVITAEEVLDDAK